MSAFRVNMVRRYAESITVEIEADSIDAARVKAQVEQEDVAFDWNQVENDGREIALIEDAEGNVVWEGPPTLLEAALAAQRHDERLSARQAAPTGDDYNVIVLPILQALAAEGAAS